MLRHIDNGLTINEGRTARDSGGRKKGHAFNSLLKDQTFNSIYDVGNLKRLARSSSRFFNPWNDSPHASKNSDDHDDKWNNRKQDGNVGSEQATRGRKTYQWVEDGNITNQEEGKYENQMINTGKSNYQTDSTSKLKNSTKLTKSNENLMNAGLSTYKSLTHDDLASRRIIIIKGLSRNASPSGVLTRVCGGPLERIVFHNHRQDPIMELYFVFPKDAQKFFAFGQTGLLLYNSQRMVLQWANETNTEDINLVHPPISKSLMNQILNGARRSLLFVKEIPNKPTRYTHHTHYANALQCYSNGFNIKDIISDFSPIGNLVDVSPIISRKLSFILYFDDIRSAINGKKQCETRGTKLNKRYHDWHIYFGNDIADRACVTI